MILWKVKHYMDINCDIILSIIIFYMWVTEPGESEEKKLQLSRGQWGHEIDCAILTVNRGVFKKKTAATEESREMTKCPW